jgi:hypothetical protein
MMSIEHPDHTGSSSNPLAPWTQSDAYEGIHTCNECGREEEGCELDLDGTSCGAPADEDYPLPCPGIMQQPAPYEPDWDSMPGGWDDRD